MSQINIKSEEVVGLLDRIVALTGEGKTEAVKNALELYEAQLLGRSDIADQIAWIRDNIHPLIDPAYLGKAPTKEEIERELDLV